MSLIIDDHDLCVNRHMLKFDNVHKFAVDRLTENGK